jgi:hypothetical protein
VHFGCFDEALDERESVVLERGLERGAKLAEVVREGEADR